MKVKKNDFIELDFTALIKENSQIFDTTNEKEARKAGIINEQIPLDAGKFKPVQICIGQEMILKSLDEEIEGKEIGKEYSIELPPKKAFGDRNPKLIKIVPISRFREQNIEPRAGEMLNLDGLLVRISSVSGGRVIIDFNNPLAGKTLIYKVKINKKIFDKKENLLTLARFFLRYSPKIKIQEKKVKIELDIEMPKEILDNFKKKVKETLNLEADIKIKKEKLNSKK